MLGAWLTELLTGPLSKLKEPCDGVAKLHAFVGKTNRASAAQHFGRLMLVCFSVEQGWTMGSLRRRWR